MTKDQLRALAQRLRNYAGLFIGEDDDMTDDQLTTLAARERLQAARYRTGRAQFETRCDSCMHCTDAVGGKPRTATCTTSCTRRWRHWRQSCWETTMTSEGLRELADKLVDPSDTLFKFHMDQAAAYLRACADALEKGPVAWTWANGEVLTDDQTDPMWKGGGAVALYPLAMPAPIRMPEPMTRAELDEVLDEYGSGDGVRHYEYELCRGIEADTLRRVKEVNE